MTDPRDVERLDSLEAYLPPGWDASLTLDDEIAYLAATFEASESLRRSRGRRRPENALGAAAANIAVGIVLGAGIGVIIAGSCGAL